MEQDPLTQKTVNGQVTLRGRGGYTAGWGYGDQDGPTQLITQKKKQMRSTVSRQKSLHQQVTEQDSISNH